MIFAEDVFDVVEVQLTDRFPGKTLKTLFVNLTRGSSKASQFFVTKNLQTSFRSGKIGANDKNS